MSFNFKPGVRYRMPVVFGPSVSPRQHPDGRPWKIQETGMMEYQSTSLTFSADREQLNAFLPPGFSLVGVPRLIINFMRLNNLYWLAGRGYGALAVNIPARYEGKNETIEGNFMTALWEGDPNAIMTGREELGFPKLFADIEKVKWSEDKTSFTGSASWYDHTFFDLKVSGLKETHGEPGAKAINTPNLWYKYMPNTAINGTGGADTIYVTTNAPHPNQTVDKPAIQVENYQEWTAENAEVNWHRATFEQQPLMHNIINGVADLKVHELINVNVSKLNMSGLGISCDELRTITPKDEHITEALHPSIK